MEETTTLETRVEERLEVNVPLSTALETRVEERVEETASLHSLAQESGAEEEERMQVDKTRHRQHNSNDSEKQSD